MFVVCGEALMDVFAEGRTDTGMALDARVGGSPFNAAVGLARLRQPVGFFGPVSRDFLGERLMQGLQAEDVDTAHTPRTDAPTTLSLIGTDAQGVPAYSFYGHGAADRQLLPSDLALLPTTLRGLHVGSYTTVVEPIASTLRLLVDRIATDMATPLSASEAAAELGLSESRFSRLFRRATGNTFTDFVNRVRVNRACHLLMETDRLVTHICYEVGFNNVANFNRRFLEIKGLTPSEFRRQTEHRFGRS